MNQVLCIAIFLNIITVVGASLRATDYRQKRAASLPHITNDTVTGTDISDATVKDVGADTGTVDGSDIAGVRDGSDILIEGGATALETGINTGSTDTGTDTTGQRENVDLTAKSEPGTDGAHSAGIQDSPDSKPGDSHQGQPDSGKMTDGGDSAQSPDNQQNHMDQNWHQLPQFLLQPSPDHHDNQIQSHGDLEPPTTMDPEEMETTTADPDIHHAVHGSDVPHSPLVMSRPGELPPLALPLTSEGQRSPVSAAEGDMPLALPQTAHSEHSPDLTGQGHLTNGGQHSSLEGVHSQPHPFNMKAAWQQLFHSQNRPVALPLTSPDAHTAPVAMAQKGGRAGQARPPPSWSQSAASGAAVAQTSAQTSGQPTTPNAINNLAAMQVMGGGDMFSNMMEAQRRMMQYNPQVWQQMQQMQMQMYQQMFPQMFPGGGNSSAGGQVPMMPVPGMYGFGEDGYNPMMMAMANGMNPYMFPTQNPQIQEACKNNPKSPLCSMPQAGMPPNMAPYMMGDEFEGGPFGEMEIEGPMAYQFLSKINMLPGNNIHPNHQEITLNHHVLKALQRRFGVNTTSGIQRKASDPQFQAFMFQVLKRSTQSVPGEYHANLSEAEVNQILASLDASAAGNERLPPGNLDHASLAEGKGQRGSSNEAVLTLDSGAPVPNPWFPGFAAQSAEPGSFAPLVQQPGEGGEPREAGEVGEAPETKPKTRTNTTSSNTTTSAVLEKAGGAEKAGKHAPLVAGMVSGTEKEAGVVSPDGGSAKITQVTSEHTSSVQASLEVPQTDQTAGQLNIATAGADNPSVTHKGDHEIQNKDAIPGLSQDARNRAFGKVDKNTGLLPGAEGGASVNGVGTTADTRPIGLQEAGIFPGANETVPVEKLPQGYSSSTVFAIAAIVLIALMIIIGPIICMLCKMRERREEKRRKMKALQNREVSENNIMEAMMLHEFGSANPSSTENLNAAAPNYNKTDQARYVTIDPEIECLNKSDPLP